MIEVPEKAPWHCVDERYSFPESLAFVKNDWLPPGCRPFWLLLAFWLGALSLSTQTLSPFCPCLRIKHSLPRNAFHRRTSASRGCSHSLWLMGAWRSDSGDAYRRPILQRGVERATVGQWRWAAPPPEAQFNLSGADKSWHSRHGQGVWHPVKESSD